MSWRQLFSAMHDSSKVICSYVLRSSFVPQNRRDVFCFPSPLWYRYTKEGQPQPVGTTIVPWFVEDKYRPVYWETTEVINSPIYSDFLKNVALQIWPHYNTLCLVSTNNCLILGSGLAAINEYFWVQMMLMWMLIVRKLLLMISALMLENVGLLPLSPCPQTPPSIRIILYSEQNYPIISSQIHWTVQDILSVFTPQRRFMLML